MVVIPRRMAMINTPELLLHLWIYRYWQEVMSLWVIFVRIWADCWGCFGLRFKIIERKQEILLLHGKKTQIMKNNLHGNRCCFNRLVKLDGICSTMSASVSPLITFLSLPLITFLSLPRWTIWWLFTQVSSRCEPYDVCDVDPSPIYLISGDNEDAASNV